MSGRRNHLRFVVSPPTHGVVRVLSDAEIESVGREDVCVISRDAAAIDERMVLEVPGDGTDRIVAAQVTETRPVDPGQRGAPFLEAAGARWWT